MKTISHQAGAGQARLTDQSAETVIIEHLGQGRDGSMEEILESFPDIKSDWFTNLAPAWNAARDIHGMGRPVTSTNLITWLGKEGLIDSIGGAAVLTGASHSWPVVEDCLYRLQELAPKRAAIPIYKQGSEGLLSISEVVEALEPLTVPTNVNKLKERRFDILTPPEKPAPSLYLAGQGICTAGNITQIVGQAKTAKSSLVAAIIANAFNGREHLGIHGLGNTAVRALIHFDTEQSRYDHHQLVVRAMHRAGITEPPEWLRSYSLADVPTSERRKLLAQEMKAAAKAHGGVYQVVVDGVADLCHDPNDPEEAFGLVEELHRLAIAFDCSILCVLHLNPGSDFKTRGHLGSQLERKSESTLALERSKDSEEITVWMPPSRHGYIPKDQGPRFAWSDEAGQHEIIEGSRREVKAAAKKEKEVAELLRLARLVVDRNGPRKWGDFIADLTPHSGSKKTAERKFTEMKAHGLLSQTLTGEWEIAFTE